MNSNTLKATKYTNLFDPGKEANEIVFCGRKNEISMILSGLKTKNQSFSVIGGRRIGKTSILKKIERELLNEDQKSSTHIIPVYVTFQDIPEQEEIFFLKDCYKMICEEIIKGLPQSSLKIALNESKDPGYQLLRKIIEDISNTRDPQLKIVLLLDEMNIVAKRPWKDTFYGNLRSLLGKPEYYSIFNIIASCVKHEFLKTGNRTSTLEHILKPVILGNLKYKEIKKMIDRVFNGKFDHTIVDEVFSSCGGHPYIFHHLMSELLQDATDIEGIMTDDVKKIKENFLYERSDLFREWINYFNSNEKELLIYFLKTTEKKSVLNIRSELRQRKIKIPIRETIPTLISFGLVNKVGDYYKANRSLMELLREATDEIF